MSADLYRSFEAFALEQGQGTAFRARSEYVRAPGLTLYCRRSLRYPGVIVLASIKADVEQQGHFTRFLEEWSPRLPLEVEQPLNPYLLAFLKRKGWRETGQWGDIHCYNEKACELIDARG